MESSEDIIEETPQKAPRKKKKRKKIFKESKDVCKIENPDQPSTHINLSSPEERNAKIDFNHPFVYYSIEEIKELPQNHIFNTQILTIGIYNYSEESGHILQSHNSEIIISLNLKYVPHLPEINDDLSAYGSYENNVFIVKFFRIVKKAIVKNYIENLRYARTFIPKKYVIPNAFKPHKYLCECEL